MKKRKLNEKQKEYYNERVEFFHALGIAVPTGLIWETAIKMSDSEVDKWLSLTTQPNPNGK